MTIRKILSAFVESRPFVSGHARLLTTQIVHHATKDESKTIDDVHLVKAARWLKAAQDAMTDGGVGGRYLLSEGWTSSYPETTGYIIPTFLRLAKELKDDDYLDRAARAVRFLLSVQLDPAATILQSEKRSLAKGTDRHEATRDAPGTSLLLEVIVGQTPELGYEIGASRRSSEIVRKVPAASTQSLELSAADRHLFIFVRAGPVGTPPAAGLVFRRVGSHVLSAVESGC